MKKRPQLILIAATAAMLFSVNGSASVNPQSDPLEFVSDKTQSALGVSVKASQTTKRQNLFEQPLGSNISAYQQLETDLETAFGTATQSRPGVKLWEITHSNPAANIADKTKIMLVQNPDGTFEISADRRKGGERNNPRKIKVKKAKQTVSTTSRPLSTARKNSRAISDSD